jgi:hypothetical protein
MSQRIVDSIQRNIQTNPEGVQNALTEGMSALTKIEARLKSDSGNINYTGFNADASHAAYMDFSTERGTIADSSVKAAKLGAAAEAMAGDIRKATATGQLSVTERMQLQDVVVEIVGSVGLAVAYVGQVIAGAGMNPGNVGLQNMVDIILAGDGAVSNVDEGGESGYNGKGLGYGDKALRTDEIVVEFNYNDKHDEIEFARQLKAQEAGMNQLTIEEYLRNRERYNTEGRSAEGNALQQAVRKRALAQKILELRESGLSYSEAKAEVKLWSESQAVLHNPDQIAGGNFLGVGGMGDAGVNSSIGAQWKYRIGAVDEYINSLLQGLSGEEISNAYLNIRLTYSRR